MPTRLSKQFIVAVILTLSTALGSHAKEQAASGALESMHLAYRHLIMGNVADLKRNQDAVAFFTEKGKQTSNPDHRKRYLALVEAYKGMAEINETIIDGFKRGSVAPAREVLPKLPALENQVEQITGKAVPRDWLTFTEMQAYYKRFAGSYKTEDKNIFPFHKKHWDQEAIRQMQKSNPNETTP